VRVDDWYWLRDRDDPEVVAHLEAENAYLAEALAPTEARQQRLFEEMVARIQETDVSTPAVKGPFAYYVRTQRGRNYAVHCRRPVGSPDPVVPADDAGTGEPSVPLDPSEQVLLDENVLAEGHDYLALGNMAVSPDHRWLAYSTDTDGSERYVMRFRDLEGGSESPEELSDTSYGVAWADDSATVFFVRVDRAMRPYQLWRHRLGTDPATDVLVCEEPDEHFYLGVSRTRDDRYVVMTLESKMTTEVHVLPAQEPEGTFAVVGPRRHGIEYGVEHDRGDPATGRPARFLIVTNDGAEDFRLLEATELEHGADGVDRWREVIPARPGVRLDGVEPFAGHLAVFERAEGETRLRVVDLATGSSTDIGQPESPATVWVGANPDYDAPALRYEQTSLITPRATVDYDFASGSRTVRKRQPVLGGYDPARYETRRLWAISEDGTEVPLSLAYRRDLVEEPGPDGAGGRGAPCLLYGYGSYEVSTDPVFSSHRLSLLDRGFVYAIAHVRGGGELGRHWYEDGRLAHKPHTFDDFVACARALVDAGWTSPERLVARGGSAGGLLIGAVANRAPELFRAMVAEVPFVDCLTTILDDTLPLTVIEWEEWGNPVTDRGIYEIMKSYSPYDNVRAADGEGRPVRYPDLLVTAGLSDPRVGFWEPAKWTAKLRAANPENRVLLKTELGAGHGGPSGRYDAWKDEALVLAFVLDALGIEEPPDG
jgi:oligopeptidase B